ECQGGAVLQPGDLVQSDAATADTQFETDGNVKEHVETGKHQAGDSTFATSSWGRACKPAVAFQAGDSAGGVYSGLAPRRSAAAGRKAWPHAEPVRWLTRQKFDSACGIKIWRN